MPGRDDPAIDGRTMRILVVEDEWFVAVENEATLLDAKYDVVGVATNAEDALTIAEATRPDLVLMDIRLPGKMDGIDIATRLRERYNIPCVFVTAHSDADIRRRAEPASPRGWLVKPFTSEQLLRIVADACKGDN